MPARLLPDKTKLRSLVDAGLTHQQIADWINENMGLDVKRSTIASAISRAGLSEATARYKEELPWRVRQEHLKHYAPRMLRLLGRRRAGLPLTEDQNQRLDSWINQLKSDSAVVVYIPDTEEGFHYVGGTWDHPDVPIREHLPL
jgi:hypothetical protein